MISTVTVVWCAAADARGQTFVVDDNGGPGVHFRDLPPAMSTVPDGAVLRVRPGNYKWASVANKGLTILGDGPAVEVDIDADFTIGSTNATQEFVIADLTMTARPPLAGTFYRLRFAGLSGSLVLSNVQSPGTDHRLEFASCSDVHVIDCRFEGRPDVGQPAVPLVSFVDCSVEISTTAIRGAVGIGNISPTGQPALRLQRSVASLILTTLRGGNGVDCTLCQIICGSAGGPGGVALEASASLVYAAKTSLRGGDGGLLRGTGSCTGMPGGDGARFANGTTAVFDASLFAGGVGSGGTANGNDAVVDASSRLASDPAVEPTLAHPAGPLTLGAPLPLTVDAQRAARSC